MRPSLRRLLEHTLDYAGMFPPAEFTLERAVEDYNNLLAGPDAWLVDRFVCQAPNLDRLVAIAKPNTRVTVIGDSRQDTEWAKSDAKAVQRATSAGMIIEAYEVRIPQTDGLEAAVAAVRGLVKDIDQDTDVYLEVGWGEDMVDAMHTAIGLFEEAGFKARTGGVTPSSFPSTQDLSAFVSECVALECRFKFTAGLHQPLRHYDPDLNVRRHGFLNVLLAGALAVSQDLNRREIESVLAIEEAEKFHFGVDDVRVGDYWLEAEQTDEFREVFGGFGSCSVDEPVEALRGLGLLQEVGA